jgi:hypothetical protein
MKRQEFAASVLRAEWDHDTRVHRRWNEAGALLESRAFTADEHAEADAAAAAAQLEANEATVTTSLGGAGVFDNLRTIAAGTGTFASNVVRDAAIRTCARALVILIRLALRRLDATD